MKKGSIWYVLSLIAVSGALPTASGVVDLGYVSYQGKHDASLRSTSFHSLKYAAPPTGSLRWRPPVTIESSGIYDSNSLIDAQTPQFKCYQTTPSWRKKVVQKILTGKSEDILSVVSSSSSAAQSASGQSEDCLTLDVVVPDDRASSKLPVVVMIHGGGYNQGSSIGSNGNQFVSFSGGQLIYVALQYRLGVFGFLSGEAVRADGTANAGLLDQRLALEWVQNHIEAFGGDPARVTIWGGSAGGGSVTSQMILYGGAQQPPFSAAIPGIPPNSVDQDRQTNGSIPEYPWWQPYHDESTLTLQYQKLLQAANCKDLRCLRALDSSALATASSEAADAAYAAGSFGYGDYWWGPSVDGTIIHDLPSREYAAGRFSRVPIMIDHSTFEGVKFTNNSMSSANEVQQSLSTLWPNTGAIGSAGSVSFFDKLLELYPTADFEGKYFDQGIFNVMFNRLPSTINNSAYWQRQTIFGDYIINCPTYTVSKALVSAEQVVYKMVFAAATQLHAVTFGYLLRASESTDNPDLADTIKDYFVGFITQRNPNASKKITKPYWPPYTTSAGTKGSSNQVLRIEDKTIYSQHDADAGERCDFFASQAQLVRN